MVELVVLSDEMVNGEQFVRSQGEAQFANPIILEMVDCSSKVGVKTTHLKRLLYRVGKIC